MSESTQGALTVSGTAFRVACIALAGRLAQDSELAAAWPGDPLTKTVLHESAHAAVGAALGRMATSISVWRSGGGITRFGDDHGEDDRTRLDDLACIEAIDNALIFCAHPPLDRECIQRETATLLRRHWRAVELFAGNLTSKLIGADEASLNRGEIRILWKFAMEKGDLNAVQNE